MRMTFVRNPQKTGHMTKRRWTCPYGDHAGVLAPARMRRIDIRRYCLPCSEEAGVLVERDCPALEQDRVRRKESRQKQRGRQKEGDAKKKVAQARARAMKRYERERVLGIHVPTHFQQVCHHTPVVVTALDHLERAQPTVKVRRRRSGGHTSGHAAPWTGAVVLTLPDECSWGQLATIVAHEIAHVCCADEEWHGSAWRAMFLAILNEAYGLDVGWPTKDGKLATVYDAHCAFEEMMEEGLGNPRPS